MHACLLSLILVVGHLHHLPGAVISAQLSRSGCAELICTIAGDQADNPTLNDLLGCLGARAREGEPADVEPLLPLDQAGAAPWPRLALDERKRTLAGVEMEPLLAGELRLLCFLGKHPERWHSTGELSERVYSRQDAAGRGQTTGRTGPSRLRNRLPAQHDARGGRRADRAAGGHDQKVAADDADLARRGPHQCQCGASARGTQTP